MEKGNIEASRNTGKIVKLINDNDIGTMVKFLSKFFRKLSIGRMIWRIRIIH
jgi:hypothetical protein